MKACILMIVLAALIGLASVACRTGEILPTEARQLDGIHSFMTQDGELIVLTGGNAYRGMAKYYAPNAEGVMTRLALIIIKDDTLTSYDMVSVPAASGAKFSTREADFVMWETHGEFHFYQGDAENLLAIFTIVPASKIAVIELEGNPTTGYTWVYTLQQEGVIREVLSEYFMDTRNGTAAAGVGGKFIFIFEAVQAGETEIIFSYLRTWEEGIPALDTVVYSAVVDENGNLVIVRYN